MVHTRLALTEKKYANDLIFLVRLSFNADGLVYCLRNAESFFFTGNTDRPGVWRLIWRRTEGSSEGVIVVCARAHEMRDLATMGGIWYGEDRYRQATRTENKRPTSSAESEIRFVISQGVLSLATESGDLTPPLIFLGT